MATQLTSLRANAVLGEPELRDYLAFLQAQVKEDLVTLLMGAEGDNAGPAGSCPDETADVGGERNPADMMEA